jgi:hypothetical protein
MAHSSPSSNVPPPLKPDRRSGGPPAGPSSTGQASGNPKGAPPVRVGAADGLSSAPPIQDAESRSEADLAAGQAWAGWRLPPWLVSFCLHLAMILILACIPLVEKLSAPFIIEGSIGQPESSPSFELSTISAEASLGEPTAIEAVDVAELVSSDISPAVPPVPWTVGPSLTEVTPELGLSGRQGALKSALLAAYGGTAATEDAVKLGLAWLARQQRKDGEWSLRGPYSNGAISENEVAATAMALIALAGAGHTHQQGDYQKTVERGVRFLVRLQDREGFFAADAPDRHQMYAQAQATIALGELYGMTGDQGLRPVVQRALDFAEQAQGQEGGWRYVPRDDSDTSVTGWFVMALMSGRMGGLSTDRRVLDRVHGFLDRVQSDSGSQYAYTSLSSNLPSYAMTAEGLLCREYLGWTKDDPRLVKGCDILSRQPISAELNERSYYYWYYATQALHHFGGEPWRKWNAAMREVLPALQVRDGREKGSWPSQNDEHASAGGRLYTTCFAIYCLEVYYRHLPLYGLAKK